MSQSILHITLLKYGGYCMTTRGIRILSPRPDSISQEELRGDEIRTSKRPDDALLFI